MSDEPEKQQAAMLAAYITRKFAVLTMLSMTFGQSFWRYYHSLRELAVRLC